MPLDSIVGVNLNPTGSTKTRMHVKAIYGGEMISESYTLKFFHIEK